MSGGKNRLKKVLPALNGLKESEGDGTSRFSDFQKDDYPDHYSRLILAFGGNHNHFGLSGNSQRSNF
jgi:hypothetical protein